MIVGSVCVPCASVPVSNILVNKMACLLTIVVSAWLHSALGVSQTLFW